MDQKPFEIVHTVDKGSCTSEALTPSPSSIEATLERVRAKDITGGARILDCLHKHEARVIGRGENWYIVIETNNPCPTCRDGIRTVSLVATKACPGCGMTCAKQPTRNYVVGADPQLDALLLAKGAFQQ